MKKIAMISLVLGVGLLGIIPVAFAQSIGTSVRSLRKASWARVLLLS
jgi:hypothetical protein